MMLKGKQPVAWKEYCAGYWLKGTPPEYDSCTEPNISEIMLKMMLNIIQSIFDGLLKYDFVVLHLSATLPLRKQKQGT